MAGLFCFGFGYTAQRLAAAAHGQGWMVAGTSRSASTRAELSARGFRAYDFPLHDPEDAFDRVTHVVSAIPPDDGGDPVLQQHAAHLGKIAALEWVGYLSTTGVYGDARGEWVDENSATSRASDRARRRLDAEGRWLDLHRRDQLPVHIFRLAGIYGPGRSAVDAVRAGRAQRICKPGHVFSRIHVDDIVQTLLASMARPNPGARYNVADDAPAPAHCVVGYACALLGVEPPPLVRFEDALLSPMASAFYADSRKVMNARIKQELGVQLLYPDYRSGLEAIVAAA